MPREHFISQFERRKRRLPHWEGPGETYMMTFKLANPRLLDLTEDRFGRLVIGAIHHFAQPGTPHQRYLLFDHTVMPDHIHMLLRPLVRDGRAESLGRITHSLKSWLAHRINGMLGRSGRVWQVESYDRIIRNQEEYEEKADYILDNPRRAGLVDDPAKWPWWGNGPG